MKQFFILFLLSLLAACSSESSIEEALVSSEPVVNELTIKRVKKIKEMFLTIPSPVETAELFFISGAEYRSDESNPAENVNRYTTNGAKALNLGVYGADLSYANVFDQSQESMIYINCAKKMADALDISSAFGVETIERFEENMNNRDSLMRIIDDAFWIIETHLKDNGQDYLSALIMTGGWIEGLYLGTKLLEKDKPNEELMHVIAAQKSSFRSLMNLLITYSNAEVRAVEKEMKGLENAYNKIDENAINPSIIFEISDAVSLVRAKIIR